jgi:hypothetical protein
MAGADEFVVKPYFQFEKFGSPSVHSTLVASETSNADASLVHMLDSCDLPPTTIAIFKEIHCFSRAVGYALNKGTISPDLTALLEDSVLLKYRLLLSPDVDWECSEDWGIEEACRLGALLYMKGVFREFPFSAIGSRKLVRKLREALCRVPYTATSAPLILWLFFMGGVSANVTSDKAWFVAQLVKVAVALKGKSWSHVKIALQKLLWIEKIHEGICRSLWREVEMNCHL